MKIDRGLQLSILRELAEAFPNQMVIKEQRGERAANLLYLAEHKLVDCGAHTPTAGGIRVVSARITAKGLDFLADDGGLTAILGVVEVRLHADTIRALMVSRINESDLPESEKSVMLEHIKQIPGTALGHLTIKLLDLALRSGPQVLAAIRTALGLAA